MAFSEWIAYRKITYEVDMKELGRILRILC